MLLSRFWTFGEMLEYYNRNLYLFPNSEDLTYRETLRERRRAVSMFSTVSVITTISTAEVNSVEITQL